MYKIHTNELYTKRKEIIIQILYSITPFCLITKLCMQFCGDKREESFDEIHHFSNEL
jgi:hypothetical protein